MDRRQFIGNTTALAAAVSVSGPQAAASKFWARHRAFEFDSGIDPEPHQHGSREWRMHFLLRNDGRMFYQMMRTGCQHPGCPCAENWQDRLKDILDGYLRTEDFQTPSYEAEYDDEFAQMLSIYNGHEVEVAV